MKENHIHALGIETVAVSMSKKPSTDISNFGERLTVLRKAAGFTQQELAQELGVSRRVVAYYERETPHPPTSLLPRLAQILGLSADELLSGNGVRKAPPKTTDLRLQHKLQQLETLGTKKRRQAIRLLDQFIHREAIKR